MVYRATERGLKRKQERRALLLKAARDEFGKSGYYDTSVPQIVAAARSSTGAFYLYFKSKEDVFVAVLKSIEEEFSAALNAAQSAVEPEVVKQMRTAVETFIEYLAAHPADARILLLDAPPLSGKIHAAWREIIESHTRSVERALRRVSPPIKRLDIPTAATCWVGSVNEAVLRWLEKPAYERPSAQVLARTIVNFNLNGIGAAARGR